jgi:copper chaperone NosL
MLISSDATGGQIVSPHDDPRFYDDIGCLAADAARLSGDARVYVRTASGTWADAVTAAYARPAGSRTPMGSGLIAFETTAAAQAAAPGAPVLTWDDVVARETAEASQ